MEHGRTGRRFRFLIPAQGMSGVGTALLNVLFGVILLGAAVGLYVLARASLRDLVSASSPLHRLDRPVGARERALGRVRATGTFRGRYDLPVCNVEHQHYVSGKNGGWRTDQGVWLAEGAELTLAGDTLAVDPNLLRFDPEDFEVALGYEANFRERAPGLDDGGRIRYACVREGEPVFVEACVDPVQRRLTACVGGDVTTLTRGDGSPAPRIRSHANKVAAGLAAGALILGLLLLYAWRAVRAGALVDALRAWNPAPKPSTLAAAAVAAAALTALAVSLALMGPSAAAARGGSPVAGYVFGVAVIVGAAVAALFMDARRAKLALAARPVTDAETMRLARVGDGAAELAVRVRRDAPTVNIPDHGPHAFVRVDVKRVITRGRSVQVEPLRAASWPAQIPVEDPTGHGVLDLTHAEVDTRATFRTVSGDDARRLLAQYAATPFGDARLMVDDHVTLHVEESYIDAGESLYLLGHIRRVEDARAESAYREMGTTPVVGGSATERLVVHAGSERSLLGDLTRERVFLQVATRALALLSFALAGALLYLRARA